MKHKVGFYTVLECAEMFRVSENTIYRMARRGDLGGLKIGNQWRFSGENLDNLQNNQKNIQKKSGNKNQY